MTTMAEKIYVQEDIADKEGKTYVYSLRALGLSGVEIVISKFISNKKIDLEKAKKDLVKQLERNIEDYLLEKWRDHS